MSNYTELTDWYEIIPDKYDFVPSVYRTIKPLSWDVGVKGSGLTLTVPINFPFDVSIPWIFWWFLKPTDQRFHKAACLHDYALVSGWGSLSSAAAFNDVLRVDGVGSFTRFLMVVSIIVWRWDKMGVDY